VQYALRLRSRLRSPTRPQASSALGHYACRSGDWRCDDWPLFLGNRPSQTLHRDAVHSVSDGRRVPYIAQPQGAFREHTDKISIIADERCQTLAMTAASQQVLEQDEPRVALKFVGAYLRRSPLTTCATNRRWGSFERRRPLLNATELGATRFSCAAQTLDRLPSHLSHRPCLGRESRRLPSILTASSRRVDSLDGEMPRLWAASSADRAWRGTYCQRFGTRQPAIQLISRNGLRNSSSCVLRTLAEPNSPW